MSQDLKKQVEFFSGSQGQLFCFWELTERLYPLTYEVSIIEIGKILNLVFWISKKWFGSWVTNDLWSFSSSHFWILMLSKNSFFFISILTQTRKYGCPRRPILSPFGYGRWCKQQLFGMTSMYWNWQNLLNLKLHKKKHIKGLRKKRWMFFMRLTTTELKRKQTKKRWTWTCY